MSTRTLRRVSTVSAAVLLLASPPLVGQVPSRQSDVTETESTAAERTIKQEEVSPASPRASIEQYLALTRAGRFADAAAYLDLPDSLRAQGPALARQLKAVLDRHVWLDLDKISAAAIGDTDDGLPPSAEHLAELRGPGGEHQVVRLNRARVDGEIRWRFSRSTVNRIPGWYGMLEDRWILEHLPAPLLQPGPYDLLWWQWTALPILLLLAGMLGYIASRVLQGFFSRFVRHTATEWDDAVLARLATPLTVACALVAIGLLLPWLGLYPPAVNLTHRVLRGAFLALFFWALWRLVDVARQVVAGTPWALASASSRTLLPLGTRVAKVVVGAFAAVAMLSAFGYPVASLIAGLGLGGLALALAAQKTVENLFGAFALGVDQPFREGDFVRVEEFVGTVEAIGLRSTRFRTLDRTIISIPNGRVADMRLESFAARDRLRLATVIGLTYQTTGAQLREVLAGFERTLREQPKIWPDGVTVRFREFGASSLNIEIMAWFGTSDWGEFQQIRQDLLLQFMEVVERAGTSFAFPTQTIHLASLPAAAGFLSGKGANDQAKEPSAEEP